MSQRITDEMYATIPAMIDDQGLKKHEIAAMFGVTPNTLQVMCSKRGISLRPGGRRQKRILLLEEEPLKLSEITLQSLREAGRALGRHPARLATDLLTAIASDNLYGAVLDEELAA